MPIRNELLLMILISVCCFLPAQRSTSKSSTLLSIHKPIKASWKSMLETLHIHNYEVAQENFSKGFILTARQEYISGPLTESHIRKITQKSKLLDGDWVKAEYQYKIYIQFHSESSLQSDDGYLSHRIHFFLNLLLSDVGVANFIK